MLCAFVHMPVKAAAQNQMLHLELRHFARYALMSNNHNIGRSVNAVLAQQLQRYQRQQHDRQQQRTTRQPQHQQQRRRNHLLLGTQELLWVREKPKPLRKIVHTYVCMCVHIYIYACMSHNQRNDQVVSSADNVVPIKTRVWVRVSAPCVWPAERAHQLSLNLTPYTCIASGWDKIRPCV